MQYLTFYKYKHYSNFFIGMGVVGHSWQLVWDLNISQWVKLTK